MNSRAWLWAACGVVGVVMPYTAVVPWLAQHGVAPDAFVTAMFADRVAAFFSIDVLVSAGVVAAWVVVDRTHLGRA
ncbi:MAG: DUF2834 domain-containing protein [Chloroflexi bacterium]|nr:DUF2834 domain-containing protein [Chloroflexota bacterium]